MDFVRHVNFDWEPSCFTVKCGTPSWGSASDIELRVLKWFEQRASNSTCNCDLKYLDASIVSDATFELSCETLCRYCLPSFVSYLETAFPGVLTIDAGSEDTETDKPSGDRFIRFAAQEVELEDGTVYPVAPFAMARYPDTVQEFDEFVKSTGYVTTAEQKGSSDSYIDNESLRVLTAAEARAATVGYVSYRDAVEYCRATGVRLPSEAEWVAASLFEPALLTPDEYRARNFGQLRNPRALQYLGTEITGTMVDDGKGCIIRRGPKWARTVDWRKRVRSHRIVGSLDIYDFVTTFRVAAQ